MSQDLLVITADADAQAIMNAVLARPQSLQIRPITFHVERHTGRDSGVFSVGPDLYKIHKGQFDHLLMLWDHHGSGCEHRLDPQQSAEHVQGRLDGVSWSGRSCAQVVDPEIEEWLWHNDASLCAYFKITPEQYEAWRGASCAQDPKGLLEYFCIKALQKKHLLPDEFKQIATRASLTDWQRSPSFAHVVQTLQGWFPPA